MRYLLLASLIFSNFVYADSNIEVPPTIEVKEKNKLVFEAQYRGRYDIYDGVNKFSYGDDSIDAKGNVRGESDDRIYLQRIIAGLTYKPSENWELKFSMHDSRAWGSSLDIDEFIKNKGTDDEYAMSYYDDHFELFETYIRGYDLFSENLTLTLGRQQLAYGDYRIFGPGKWGNTIGWLWDGVHASYKHDKNFIDLWYGQIRVKDSDDFSIIEKHRYQGVGLYSHFEMSSAKIEPFFAWRNDLHHDVTPELNYYYVGGRVYDLTPGFIYDSTAVKQFGENGDKDVDAYAYILKGGYKYASAYQPTLTLGYVYASGDKDPNDTKMQTFSTPFGATDGMHYGRMDVVALSNMNDIQAKFSMKPMPKMNFELAYHHFNLSKATDSWYMFGYKNKTGNSYTHIGDEYDMIIKYQATKNLSLRAIGAYMNSGEFIAKNYIAQNNASKVFLEFIYNFQTK